MHELIFFSMFLLVLIRLVGVIVSVNFYYESKSNTYIYLTIGWSLWIIAGIIALLSAITVDQTLENFVLLMNYLTGPIAIFFIGSGLSSYYIKISSYKIKLFSVVLIIFPFVINFSLGIVLVALYARIFQFFGITIVFLLPFLKYTTFKERIGKSIKWYYLTCFSILLYIPLAIINMLTPIYSGSFQSENIIIIVGAYSSIIIMTILLIAFIIHLEYTITSEQGNQLKDKYSHNLGNILQVIYSSADLFKRIVKIDDNDKVKLELIEKKCNEAAKLIDEIRNL